MPDTYSCVTPTLAPLFTALSARMSFYTLQAKLSVDTYSLMSDPLRIRNSSFASEDCPLPPVSNKIWAICNCQGNNVHAVFILAWHGL